MSNPIELSGPQSPVCFNKASVSTSILKFINQLQNIFSCTCNLNGTFLLTTSGGSRVLKKRTKQCRFIALLFLSTH